LFKNLLVRGSKSGFSGLTLLAGYHKKTLIFILCAKSDVNLPSRLTAIVFAVWLLQLQPENIIFGSIED